MAQRQSLTSLLYKLVRTLRDLQVLSSANPIKIARRAKNKFLTKKIFRKFF